MHPKSREPAKVEHVSQVRGHLRPYTGCGCLPMHQQDQVFPMLEDTP